MPALQFKSYKVLGCELASVDWSAIASEACSVLLRPRKLSVCLFSRGPTSIL